MKKKKTFFELGDMSLYFILDEDSGSMGMGMVPSESKEKMAIGRPNFEGDPELDELPEEWRPTVPREIFSLAQVHCHGDASNEGPGGRSLLNGQTSNEFRFESQDHKNVNGSSTIKTLLKADNGLLCRSILKHNKGEQRLSIQNSYENSSDQDLTLEMASSFSLSDLSPFDETCSHNRLYLHRYKTFWSREARHVVDSIHELQMSPSWHVAHYANEKFGQVGSWSTNGWYPQLALEDREAGVMWGVRLAWSGSWQMELFRRDDQLNIAGGLADYDFGHWRKTLKPGEELEVPEAFLTVCKGDFDRLSSRLVEAPAEKSRDTELPLTFNDWCTNWGVPSEESVGKLAGTLKHMDLDYLVIDAGWYKPDDGLWNLAHGDWNPNEKMYPNGLRGAAELIRQNGMKPGLWFEFETVGVDSEMFHRSDLLLHAHGKPIQTGARRFLDFRKAEVQEYLDKKVIATLLGGGFVYIKNDYNSSIGKGADGAESLGEALREHLLAVGEFLLRLREKVPGIVIEDCASGGMRLDPYTLSLCDLGSFSDAHASPEIPIIAANLHRVMHPSKSLVWAVVRPEESIRRIQYSMAAVFLGRPCLSGDIDLLNSEQLEVINSFLALYRTTSHLLLNGSTRIAGGPFDNYRKPSGAQVLIRENLEKGEALLVCHGFEFKDGCQVSFRNKGYKHIKSSISDDIEVSLEKENIIVRFNKTWEGAIFHLGSS